MDRDEQRGGQSFRHQTSESDYTPYFSIIQFHYHDFLSGAMERAIDHIELLFASELDEMHGIS